jgi:hypothetical protein
MAKHANGYVRRSRIGTIFAQQFVVNRRFKHGGNTMADRTDGSRLGGIGVGGILVIVGVILAFLLGHWWIGLIIALIGLVFFGGFAKGKWY